MPAHRLHLPWQRHQPNHARHVLFLWSGFIILLAGATLYFFRQGALDFQYKRIYQDRIQNFSTAIQNRLNALHGFAHHLAGNESLVEALSQGRSDVLQSLVNRAQLDDDVSGIVVADSQGVAVVRSRAVTTQGDVVLETTAWGRQVANGQDVAVVEQGTTYPLIMIGATPIMRDGRAIGAIGVADFMTTPVLQRLESPLPRFSQIIAYGQDAGALASTISDPKLEHVVAAVVNPGSSLIANDQAGKLLRLGSRTYVVNNMIFPGLERSPGGLLLLLPFPQVYRAWALSLIGAMLIISLGFALRASHSHPTHPAWTWITVGSALIILLTALILSSIFTGQHTTVAAAPHITLYNSTLGLQPAGGVFDVHYDQRFAIQVHTGGERVNAFKVHLQYDPAAVNIKDILMTTSICSLVTTKKIDANQGIVTINCGLPHPGFSSTTGTIAEIIAHPVRPGSFSLTFLPDTAVLADDGLGTDVLRQTTDATYQVSAPVEPSSTLPTLALYSPSNPNPTQWSSQPNVELTWPNVSDATYRFSVDRSSTSRNQPDQSVTRNLLSVHPGGEGAWYVHVGAARGKLLGPISTYRVQLDSTPPSPPLIGLSQTSVRSGQIIRLHLSSTDSLSGLQKNFYLRIDRDAFLPVRQDIELSLTRTGKHTLSARVFDNAGNATTSTVAIDVTK